MSTRDMIIHKKQQNNMKDLMDNGLRLRYGAQSWIVAKSSDEQYVLIGGLGCMGRRTDVVCHYTGLY